MRLLGNNKNNQMTNSLKRIKRKNFISHISKLFMIWNGKWYLVLYLMDFGLYYYIFLYIILLISHPTITTKLDIVIKLKNGLLFSINMKL